MRRLLCAAFGHRRDGKRARPSYRGWRAPCLNCGEYLLRTAPGRWTLDEEAVGFVPAKAGSADYPARRDDGPLQSLQDNHSDAAAPARREGRSQ